MTDIGAMIRESFGRGDDIRDAGLTTPEDVVRFDNLVYGSDPAWQALDVYRPRSAAGETLPVIVSVHGGGWVYGDKERYQFYCMSLAQRGFAVVNFTYRLAPEFQYPAPLEDTNLVFGWILRHADQYGLDTNQLFAVGDSAGGNILGLYAAFCTNPAYVARFSFQPHPSVKLRAVGLFCGDYEIDPAQNPDALSTQIMQVYLPEGGQPPGAGGDVALSLDHAGLSAGVSDHGGGRLPQGPRPIAGRLPDPPRDSLPVPLLRQQGYTAGPRLPSGPAQPRGPALQRRDLRLLPKLSVSL